MNTESFIDKWPDYLVSNKESIARMLEHNYGPLKIVMKKQIGEAMLFWKFVLEKLASDPTDDCKVEWQKRCDLLAPYVSHRNPFIGLVAMVESLPTSIWRKILWKANIDFMSFESFLRRIDAGQFRVIKENYEDFCNGLVPRAFSRWERFWGKLSIEKFLNECLEYDTRYCNKAAMSYNLLGLDFGFNAYPEGVNDDEKVVEISPLRFLSVKNHADDFSVNTEDGKYWWLYQKARSNYAWNPDKRVRLNTHICPGFWYTLFIHLLFWVISPAVFIGFIGAISQNFFQADSWWKIFFFVPGFFTPFWLLFASLRFAIINLAPEWLKKGLGSFFDLLSRHEENIAATIFFIVISGLGGFLGYAIFQGLNPSFGAIWTIFIMLALIVYFGYKVHTSDNDEGAKRFMKYPWYFRIPILAVIGSVLAKFTFIYPLAAEVLAAIAIFPLVTAGIVYYISGFEEKKLEAAYGYLQATTLALAIVSFGVGVVFMFFSLPRISEFGSWFPMFFLMLGFVMFCQGMVIWLSNPRVIKAEKVAKEANFYTSSTKARISKEMILENPWLLSLDLCTKNEVLRRMVKFVENHFWSEDFLKVYKVLVPNVTMAILEALEARQKDLRNLERFIALAVVTRVISGQAYDEALLVSELEYASELEKKAVRQKIWGRIKKILKVIIFPLLLVFFVIGLIIELITTLARLFELFNKRCPYVTQKRTLSFYED